MYEGEADKAARDAMFAIEELNLVEAASILYDWEASLAEHAGLRGALERLKEWKDRLLITPSFQGRMRDWFEKVSQKQEKGKEPPQ